MPPEIRFLRKQLGLSGIDLAMHLGATPESVSRWENGIERRWVSRPIDCCA
ncbi:MAG: helix-turn-helix domain-containing protein [Acidobacteriota bacterium]